MNNNKIKEKNSNNNISDEELTNVTGGYMWPITVDQARTYISERYRDYPEVYYLATDKLVNMFYSTNKRYTIEECKKVIDEVYEEYQKSKGN